MGYLHLLKNKKVAESSFDLPSSGLWAQHASTAPPRCSIFSLSFLNIRKNNLLIKSYFLKNF